MQSMKGKNQLGITISLLEEGRKQFMNPDDALFTLAPK